MKATDNLILNFKNGGIYKIVNTLNNKIYIGSTKSFKQRYIQHLSKLSTKTHNNKHLLASYEKNSGEFEMDVIEVISDFSSLLQKEQECIIKYNTIDNSVGYNLTSTTTCPSHCKIVKEKISASTKKLVKKEIEKTGEWRLTKFQISKGSIPWNKGKKIVDTTNFHTKKTKTNALLQAHLNSSIRSREKGNIVVCLDEKNVELFVFRSQKDLIDLFKLNDFGFTVSESRLCKAIKNKKLYKGHYFIMRAPNESDLIRKSDELREGCNANPEPSVE